MTYSPAYSKENTQQAGFSTTNHSGKIAQNRKEKHFYQQMTLVAVTHKLTEVMQARFYATNAKHYCCVWIHDSTSNTHVSGGGNASGYGYHKASAAFGSACDDAKIWLKYSVDGVGDSAIESAMKAIGIALGYKYEDLAIIHAHA